MFGSPWLSSCVDLKLLTYGLGWCSPNFSVDLTGLLAEKSWYQPLWVSFHREDASSLAPGGFRAGCSILEAEQKKRDGEGKAERMVPGFSIYFFMYYPCFWYVLLSLTMPWCPSSQAARDPLFYPAQKVKFQTSA